MSGSVKFYNFTGLDLVIKGGDKDFDVPASSKDVPPSVSVSGSGWNLSTFKIQSSNYSADSTAYQIAPIALSSSSLAYDPAGTVDIILGVDSSSFRTDYTPPAVIHVNTYDNTDDNFVALRKVCNRYVDADTIVDRYIVPNAISAKYTTYTVALPASIGSTSSITGAVAKRTGWFANWVASPFSDCEETSVWAWIFWAILLVIIVAIIAALSYVGYRKWKMMHP